MRDLENRPSGPHPDAIRIPFVYTLPGLLLFGVLVTAWRLWTLFVDPFPLFFDEAQYWSWSLDLDWGYFSKPPMVAWVIAATTALFGHGEAAVRMGSSLAYLAGAPAVYLLAARLFGPRTGFWSAAVFITLPGVAFSALLISTDPFLLMCWAWGLYVLVRALETPGNLLWWTLLGAAMGLGLLAKYAMIFFPLSLAVHLAFAPDDRRVLRRPGPWLALAVMALFYLPNFAWNAANGFVSYAHTGDNVHLDAELFNLDKMGEFLGAQFAVFGPLLFLALLWIFVRMRTVGADPRMRLLICFALPVLAAITLQSLLSRAHANWAATAYVSAAPLVTAWAMQMGRDWVVRLSILLHILAAGLLYNFDAVARDLGVEMTRAMDPKARVRGWDRIGAEISLTRADYPEARLLFDERAMMATMLYYVRPHPMDAVRWNPTGRIRDHYDLTTRMPDPGDHAFLLVTQRSPEEAARIAERFEEARREQVIRMTLYPGLTREVRLYYLRGFRGYGDE